MGDHWETVVRMTFIEFVIVPCWAMFKTQFPCLYNEPNKNTHGEDGSAAWGVTLSPCPGTSPAESAAATGGSSRLDEQCSQTGWWDSLGTEGLGRPESEGAKRLLTQCRDEMLRH